MVILILIILIKEKISHNQFFQKFRFFVHFKSLAKNF